MLITKYPVHCLFRLIVLCIGIQAPDMKLLVYHTHLCKRWLYCDAFYPLENKYSNICSAKAMRNFSIHCKMCHTSCWFATSKRVHNNNDKRYASCSSSTREDWFKQRILTSFPKKERLSISLVSQDNCMPRILIMKPWRIVIHQDSWRYIVRNHCDWLSQIVCSHENLSELGLCVILHSFSFIASLVGKKI